MEVVVGGYVCWGAASGAPQTPHRLFWVEVVVVDGYVCDRVEVVLYSGRVLLSGGGYRVVVLQR